MRNERTALTGPRIGVPEEILFDGKRRAGREGTIDAIGPPPKVGVTVVRIHNDSGAGTSGADLRRARQNACRTEAGACKHK